MNSMAVANIGEWVGIQQYQVGFATNGHNTGIATQEFGDGRCTRVQRLVWGQSRGN